MVRPILFLVLTLVILTSSCSGKKEIPVEAYYDYDFKLPLSDTVLFEADSVNYTLRKVGFTSIHDQRVYGLLSIPNDVEKPMPVVLLLHGVGDRKTVDYIEAGIPFFTESGYAVFRIDVANHGERKTQNYEVGFTGDYKYWTRDLISQTVFDLRRSIDFLSTCEEIDPNRIGFLGISLGGFIGTIFCSVDERVKAPALALTGGGLNVMFGVDAMDAETRNYLSIIDPINFVEKISPRPLLMINAENDEVVPPITSKMLYKKAGDPKNIIWYPAKHRNIPLDKTYNDVVQWFNKYL